MATPADRNYSNARRSGRTKPGLIERRDPIADSVAATEAAMRLGEAVWAKLSSRRVGA